MEESFNTRVERGNDLMGNSAVAICALVRDCETALKNNIPFINELAAKFKDSKIVVIENDSVDRTKEILQNWAIDSSNVHIHSEDYGTTTIQKDHQGQAEKTKYFSNNRIEKMANYRNIYLNYVKTELKVDFVIMIDLDVHNIDLDGISNSFGFEKPWDSINSNGRKLTPQNPLAPYFYDTFAFRDIDDFGPTTMQKIKQYQRKYKNLKKGEDFIQVHSGFNGLAIYRWDSIKNLNYRFEENEDDIVKFSCEHVTFHDDMRSNGQGNIYLNPSQIVEYEKLSFKLYWDKFMNKISAK